MTGDGHLRDLVLATHNEGKVVELRRILGDLPVRLRSAADVDLPDVEEGGETFEANAVAKAVAGAAACGLPCVADDSGLEVAALDGEPGVRSARYAGVHGDDEANLRLLLQRADGLADRRARFVCVAALALPDGTVRTAAGELRGRLAERPTGSGGFGYDPVVVPCGEQRTVAELDADEKDAISHRGEAFRALRPAIAGLLGVGD